jgi:hypothetical protein
VVFSFIWLYWEKITLRKSYAWANPGGGAPGALHDIWNKQRHLTLSLYLHTCITGKKIVSLLENREKASDTNIDKNVNKSDIVFREWFSFLSAPPNLKSWIRPWYEESMWREDFYKTTIVSILQYLSSTMCYRPTPWIRPCIWFSQCYFLSIQSYKWEDHTICCVILLFMIFEINKDTWPPLPPINWKKYDFLA